MNRFTLFGAPGSAGLRGFPGGEGPISPRPVRRVIFSESPRPGTVKLTGKSDTLPTKIMKRSVVECVMGGERPAGHIRTNCPEGRI